jgi:hypothetical protein
MTVGNQTISNDVIQITVRDMVLVQSIGAVAGAARRRTLVWLYVNLGFVVCLSALLLRS